MNDILPVEFIPYEEIDLCSNKLINVYGIIGIEQFPPLLIGKGEVPQIWFYSQDISGNWLPLIQKNISSTQQIRTDISIANKLVKLWMGSALLIEAINQTSNYCKISQIDLRPLGLNIHGSKEKLLFAGTSYSNNTFTATGFVFEVSTNQKHIAMQAY